MYQSFPRIVAYNLIALAVVLALTPDVPQPKQEAQVADCPSRPQDASPVHVDHAKAVLAERARTPPPETDTPPPRSR